MSVECCVDFGEICRQHGLPCSEDLERGFLEFKRCHIDTLEFVDGQMMRMYGVAFFCNFFSLKAVQVLRAHKFNRRIFLKALEEVKKAQKSSIETEEELVCNLYSIKHGFP